MYLCYTAAIYSIKKKLAYPVKSIQVFNIVMIRTLSAGRQNLVALLSVVNNVFFEVVEMR